MSRHHFRSKSLQQLTDQGRQRIDELAQRYSVSSDAVMMLLRALVNNNGNMAQFNHPELGGGGQWMRGGMTMVGDMFNYGLKSKVDGLCSELSQLLAQQPFVPFPAMSQSQGGGQQEGSSVGAGSVSLFVPEAAGRTSAQWWPAELGFPNGRGGQNRTLESWSRRRRVVGKAEHNQDGANPRFVVTSLARSRYAARALYEDLYCARGSGLADAVPSTENQLQPRGQMEGRHQQVHRPHSAQWRRTVHG
jgi:hypothetical protein